MISIKLLLGYLTIPTSIYLCINIKTIMMGSLLRQKWIMLIWMTKRLHFVRHRFLIPSHLWWLASQLMCLVAWTISLVAIFWAATLLTPQVPPLQKNIDVTTLHSAALMNLSLMHQTLMLMMGQWLIIYTTWNVIVQTTLKIALLVTWISIAFEINLKLLNVF